MPLILNIETATSVCSVAVSKGGTMLALEETDEKNMHAEKITIFIQSALAKASITLEDLDAIAVGSGPGSYTGLRIGTSAAKGLCYALNKPLIAISTLKAMAEMARMRNGNSSKIDFYCPMIDARRLEVYTALYDSAGIEVIAPEARILEPSSYSTYLKSGTVAFFGDGSAKMKELLNKKNAEPVAGSAPSHELWLDDIRTSAENMLALAAEAYRKKNFSDVAYYEPFYLKDFVGKIA